MNDRLFALLVYDRADPLESLKLSLKELSVDSWRAQTCDELRRFLCQIEPDLVFTDTVLPDGSWVDVINLTEEATAPTNVILVGSSTDTKLCVSAIERGAFDFVLPPFGREQLARVVRSAGLDVRNRREARARAAAA